MKYKIITSFLFLGLFLCAAKSQTKEIPIREVIEKIYTTYDISSLPYPRVEFEKRKYNWYIKTIDFDGKNPVRSEPRLFYDGSKKSFIELSFPKMDTTPSINYQDYMDETEIYNYDLQSFYGYAGWYHDVIKEYRGSKNLSDNQLYALGRAYNSHANAPITNQVGDAPDNDIFNLSFNIEAFSQKQLKEFIAYADSGIEKFRELAARNPHFPTRVGDIRIKYANEIIFKFHQQLTFSKSASDKMVIPKGIYNDSIISLAKGWLQSCPSKSILLSFGDNDFYPVLYLQKAEGLRKDVYLINYNLLGIDKFIYRATQPQFESPGIRLSVDTNVYKGRFNEYIYRKDGVSGIFSVKQLIDKLRQYANPDSSAFTLVANSIAMDPKIKVSAAEMVTNTVYNISLKDATYLLKNHWILLDIINNAEDRKIAFTNGFVDELKALNDYLVQEGSVFI